MDKNINIIKLYFITVILILKIIINNNKNIKYFILQNNISFNTAVYIFRIFDNSFF